MLVDINLLPKKENKNRTVLLLIIIILLIILSGGLFLFFQHEKVVSNEKQLTSQITILQKKRAEEEMKYATDQDSSDVIKLEKAVQWADDYFIETVPLLNHLTGLLSERGFFQTFSYVEDGVVSIVVQFDTKREVAHYVGLLNESPFITKTTLNSVTANSIDGQTVSQQKEDSESKEKEVNQEETKNIEESADVNAKNNGIKNGEYLPRYVASLELTINKEYLKSVQREGK
ncbi:PilN domain-containing protein [Fredinandcohnia quinoae]|uniref:PilN domain-containing protein n=1 Tax=Fredinandcohnia quinoae TaxID=2918902 RepID=A0AAW5EBL6_9BACI|nr:PilN domain-containing protein [Fredinandcohnia sp. SECRCQ15]MCH1626568.1 PilN domain-containing protein [Fredinandcohnia sp. SECRCQ15]